MTTDKLELLEELLSIDAKDAGALGFMARPLVQVTLPHTNPGDIPAYTRTCGNLHLTIQPKIEQQGKKFINYGLAYGTIPRLVMAWLSTETVKTKSREIPLGDSLSSFMRALDLLPTGGRWGTIGRLKQQVTRLFSSTFSLRYDETNNLKDPGLLLDAGFRLASRYHFFWDPQHPEQVALFNSSVTLSEDFYNIITNKPVPVDMRVLKAIRKSPLAIDIYTWLTYRMSYLEKPNTIPWERLRDQFGSEYGELKKFKFNFVKRLEDVLALYPAKVQAQEKALLLLPSKPSIGKIR
jgi:hypothetical protein